MSDLAINESASTKMRQRLKMSWQIATISPLQHGVSSLLSAKSSLSMAWSRS
jgi:hypothetical protein